MPDIQLSRDEFKLIQDQRIFEIKVSIMSKMSGLFSGIEESIREELKDISFEFPENLFLKSGKISRGENYRNCPYLVLDYPRLFSKTDIFSFRTIFWWGHYFSNAFIIGGNSYHAFSDRLSANLENLRDSDWYICVHHNPWRLEADESNYKPFKNLSEAEIKKIIGRYRFVKMAEIYPLDHFGLLDKSTRRFISKTLQLLR